MSKSDEFRQYAEEAMRLARQSKTENDEEFHKGKDKPRRLNIMNERIAIRETPTSVEARKLNSDFDMAVLCDRIGSRISHLLGFFSPRPSARVLARRPVGAASRSEPLL
jgi:hypothetical protein